MIIYTVSWHEKQIKSCKKQIDIQDYINCIHVDLKKTCLEMQRPTEKQELLLSYYNVDWVRRKQFLKPNSKTLSKFG